MKLHRYICKGWVWEEDVSPPTQSVKLKIICEKKMCKMPKFKEYIAIRSFLITLYYCGN